MIRESFVRGALSASIFSALTVVVAAVLPCQALQEQVANAKLEFAFSKAGGTASGADFLLSRARAAEFTVIGESHGNVETCTLTHWLLRELRSHGYGAFATETGPCTTDHLAKLAAAGGVDRVVRFVKEQPFSVAFLSMREEAQLFADAIALGYATWGLDQEFVGSPRFLLSELATRADGEAAKAVAATWRDRARSGFAHFAKTGDRSKAFMAVARRNDWRELTAAFHGESAELQRILGELRSSQQIYALHQRGRYYENNRQRIGLMKRHLADQLRGAPGMKAVLKFGSAHAGRGYSPYDQLDIGNHAAEAAVTRGGDSFHLFVFARGSVAEDGSKKDFVAGATSLAPFFAAQSVDEGCVFDLRKLRPLLSREAVKRDHPAVHAFVFRFDALVLLPELHASTSLVPMPRARK